MSIKSMTLMASLFLILTSPTWADYTSPGVHAEDEMEAATAKIHMALLPSSDRMGPLALFEVEQSPSKKLSMRSIEEKVQEALENQHITDEVTGLPPVVLSSVVEEYTVQSLAHRVQFSHTAKDASWIEKIKEALNKAINEMGSHDNFWHEQMLN